MDAARLYLDHAATTPVAPEVRDAMLPWLGEQHGNPSSLHRRGQRARAGLEEARERVAHALGARPAEMVFTSGASEALDLALRGALAERPGRGLLVGATEHAAVTATARRLREEGRPVAFVPPSQAGAVTPEVLDRALTEAEAPVGLVALMHTNNETGVVQDVAALAERAHAHGAAFLCDAVQAFGFEPLDAAASGADLLAVSAHKIYGPSGAGALWVREGTILAPVRAGGAQERGMRPGTEALPALVGFGVAAERAARGRPERAAAAAALRDRLEAGLLRLEGVRRNGAGPRGPKHANLRFEGVDGEMLLMALDDLGVEASAGSACAAGSLEPSHVLLAMGARPEEAKASVRFSVGEGLDAAAVDEAVRRVGVALERCRALAW